MTDREKAIVMAYTGVCMLAENKFQIFHQYVEDIMGRPVQTIEMGMGSVANEIKEKARPDFLKLCEEDQEPSVTPQLKMGRCKNCKWWKDSDGLYRRGGHAESQCPINRREVFEGNGYCYMFEPKMQEVEE